MELSDGIGKKCTGCGKPIWVIEEEIICTCGAPYHKMCWRAMQVCS